LLDWAGESGSWIFEADHTMEFPSGRAPLAALGSAGGRVVYFDTFGKMLFP
jgi:DNA-binding transcriptional MocR family regulator